MPSQTRSATAHVVHTTLPGSFTVGPLTPPPTTDTEQSLARVLHIAEDIRNKKAKTGGRVGVSRVPPPSTVYTLGTEAYQHLLQLLQGDEDLAGFVEHKLRLDYFPATCRLVLRMPTAAHERFIA